MTPNPRMRRTPSAAADAQDVRGSSKSKRLGGEELMSESTSRSIKVGVITDTTGPLSFLGIANANVARMVINDINAKGGLVGQKIDLHLEDSATTDSVG